MKPAPKAETLKRLREATGMGWRQTKLFFAGRSGEPPGTLTQYVGHDEYDADR